MVQRKRLAVPVTRRSAGPHPDPIFVAAIQLDYNPAYRSTIDYLIEPWPDNLTENSSLSSLRLQDRSLNSMLDSLRAELRSQYLAHLSARLTGLLDYLSDQKVDLVCLPEYCVPAELLPSLISYSNRFGVILPSHSVTTSSLSALQEVVENESPLERGQAAYVVALKDAQQSLFLQAKVTRSRFEPSLRTAREFKLVPSGTGLTLGVYMCSDFLQGRESVAVGDQSSNPALIGINEPDLRVVCSYTPSTGPFFDAATQDLLRTCSLERRPTLFVNHARAGGTSLFALMQSEQEVESRDEVTSYRLPPHVEAVVVYEISCGPQLQARTAPLTPEPQSRILALHLVRDAGASLAEAGGGELATAAQRSRVANDALRAYMDQRLELVRDVREAGFETNFADIELGQESSLVRWRTAAAEKAAGLLRDIHPTAEPTDRHAIEARRARLEAVAGRAHVVVHRPRPSDGGSGGTGEGTPTAKPDSAPVSPTEALTPEAEFPHAFEETINGERSLTAVLKLSSFSSTSHPEVTVPPWRSILTIIGSDPRLQVEVEYDIFRAGTLGLSTRLTEYTIEMFIVLRFALRADASDEQRAVGVRLLRDVSSLLRTGFGRFYRFVHVSEPLWGNYQASQELPVRFVGRHVTGRPEDGTRIHRPYRSPSQISRALRFLFSRSEPARLRINVRAGDPSLVVVPGDGGELPPAPVVRAARTGDNESVVDLIDEMALLELLRPLPSEVAPSAEWRAQLALELSAAPSTLVPEFVFRSVCGENFRAVSETESQELDDAAVDEAATLQECLSLLQFPAGSLPSYGDRSSLGVFQVPFEVLEAENGVTVGHGFHPDGAEALPIRLAEPDRRKHLYIIGKTGTGKTSALLTMAVQDIEAGHGLCVIDPHGDLVEDILARVPERRASDLVLFDPTDTANPPGLNLLEYDRNDPTQRDFVLDEAVSIFLRLYGHEIFGPRIQNYFRNGALALMSDPSRERTLVDIGRLFLDDDFFKYITEESADPSVEDFVRELKATTDYEKGTILPYFQSKLTPFIANARVRNVLGQSRSTVDFRDAMDSGKIVLVNLSKGKLGELTSRLFGMVLVSKATWAALSRAHLSRAERRPFYLYVDEFQNFTTDAFLTILSEARKYGLCLTLAHQFLEQLRISDNYTQAGRDALDAAIFGNVANIVAFQVGSADAARVAREVCGSDALREAVSVVLSAQPKFHAVAKFDCGGETSTPFSLQTRETTVAPNTERSARVKQYVAERTLLPRSFVEEELASARDDYKLPKIPWNKPEPRPFETGDPNRSWLLDELGHRRQPSGRTSGAGNRNEAEPVSVNVSGDGDVAALATRAGLPKALAAELASRFSTCAEMRNASDEDLRAIPGVGSRRIGAIRLALAEARRRDAT